MPFSAIKCLLDIDGGREIKLARCESILLKAGKAGTLKLTASGGQIHIVGSHFDAYADRLTGCEIIHR